MTNPLHLLTAAIIQLAVASLVIAAAPPEKSAAWNAHVQQFLADHFKANPGSAVQAGKHEYDGEIGDFSEAGLQKEIARLHAVRDKQPLSKTPTSTSTSASSAITSSPKSTAASSGWKSPINLTRRRSGTPTPSTQTSTSHASTRRLKHALRVTPNSLVTCRGCSRKSKPTSNSRSQKRRSRSATARSAASPISTPKTSPKSSSRSKTHKLKPISKKPTTPPSKPSANSIAGSPNKKPKPPASSPSAPKSSASWSR